MDKTAREYVVCPCRKVTRGEIEDIVREKHIDYLKDLCDAAIEPVLMKKIRTRK